MRVNEYPHPLVPLGKKNLTKKAIGRTADIQDPNKYIKWGIWVYFFLIIFEGALRKWFLPSLATPLLVIRDPIVILVLILAWNKGLIPANKYLVGMVIIGIISVCTAMQVGHKNFAIAAYGARILILHFPMIFVIGRVFSRDDVIKTGKLILWLSIPMVMLIAVQFYSPQSAFVNRGIGGDLAGAGFEGGGDFFRSPGTFSFTNGVTLFYGFTSLFIIYFWLNKNLVNKYLLIGATVALLAAIPLSISRGLLFQVIINVLFGIIATTRKPEYLGRMLFAIAGAVVAFVILSNTSFFSTAIGAFSNRFETANENEGGLGGVFLDRYLGGMMEALKKSSEEPELGRGIGMGTNVGSMLMGGNLKFLISEGEWGRLIGELGPILGISVIVIRLLVSTKILIGAYKKLVIGDLLPWILLAFCLTNIPQGQWGQPTSLGFSVMIGGLILASLRGSVKPQTTTRQKFIRMHARVTKQV